jgi:hypothetical protein
MGNEKELANCDEHTKRDKKKKKTERKEEEEKGANTLNGSWDGSFQKLRIASTYIQHCCRYCCIV